MEMQLDQVLYKIDVTPDGTITDNKFLQWQNDSFPIFCKLLLNQAVLNGVL